MVQSAMIICSVAFLLSSVAVGPPWTALTILTRGPIFCACHFHHVPVFIIAGELSSIQKIRL